MRKIIYGSLASLLAGLGMSFNAVADEQAATIDDAQPFNLAFYYASTRYRSTDSNRVGDFYRSRHKYQGGGSFYGNGDSNPRQANRHAQQQRAPLPPVVKPAEFLETDGSPTFVFNPSELNWGAYDADGRLINYGRASGGRDYCADVGRGCKTPSGSYNVYRKGGADCKSRKFPIGKGGAWMGWCMFFNGGYAIHASHDVPNYNASHGCVRVKPDAAHWLANHFMKIGTKVIVRGY